MDSLTQITLGAAVGEAVLGRRVGNKAPLWGAALGTLPDLDVLASPFMTEMGSLAFHRGLTHSIFFAVVAAPLIGWGLGRLHRKADASWRGWALLAFLAITTHFLLDSFTNYGTQVFYPFSRYPVIFGTIFIIDPLYTLPLAAGVLAAVRYRRTDPRRLRSNRWGLIISSAYLLITVGNKLYVTHVFHAALEEQGITYSRTFIDPTPFNNLLWTVVAEADDQFYIGYYSLLDGDRQIDFQPEPKQYDLIEGHLNDPAIERLRWFSRGYFVVRAGSDGRTYIHDLRFGRADLGLRPSGASSAQALSEDGPPASFEPEPYIFTFQLHRSPAGTYVGFEQQRPALDVDGDILQRFADRVLGEEADTL